MIKRKNIEILVKGAYGAQNFGDDALQYFLIEWFKKHNYNPVFMVNKSPYLKKIFPNTTFISQDEVFMVNANTLILGGGTQFFAFKKITLKEKLAFYVKHLSFKKLIFTFQKRVLNKKINVEKSIGLGLGLGPFHGDALLQESVINNLKNLDQIYTRDRLSYEFAKKANKNTLLYSDICFLPEIINFKEIKKEKTVIKKIGIIVRDWEYSAEGSKYYTQLNHEVKQLNAMGYSVTYILFKPEEHWEEYLKKQNENYIKWRPSKMDITMFLKELSQFDLMISARFHGIIFSSLLGIPSISIGIEQKLKLVKEFFPNSLQVWDYPFSSNLTDKVSMLAKNYPNSLKMLAQETKQNQEKTLEMFEQLKSILKQN